MKERRNVYEEKIYQVGKYIYFYGIFYVICKYCRNTTGVFPGGF